MGIKKSIGKTLTKELSRAVKNSVDKSVIKKLALPLNIGFAGSVAVGSVLTLSAYERRTLEYARYDIDGGGKAADNVRLVFLSDLHEREFGKDNSRLLEMIYKADPDAVLIGGDMIIADKNHPENIRTGVTRRLCAELVKKYPVFYSEGNHEQRLPDDSFIESLRKTGVRYLRDETVNWKYNISITGLNLEKGQYLPVIPQNPDPEKMLSKVGCPDTKRFNILMPHSPLFLKSYASMHADLVLSGHFHGGTIRLPGDVGLMTPQYQFFNTNVVGLKRFGRTFMIISSGLGTHSINLRINNKPQVVVVDIKK